jgi:hypothetical protein
MKFMCETSAIHDVFKTNDILHGRDMKFMCGAKHCIFFTQHDPYDMIHIKCCNESQVRKTLCLLYDVFNTKLLMNRRFGSKGVKLVDLGCAVDRHLYPPGTCMYLHVCIFAWKERETERQR